MHKSIEVAKKLDIATKLLTIAVSGLASANRGNPFISKSQAMTRINEVNAYRKRLALQKIEAEYFEAMDYDLEVML